MKRDRQTGEVFEVLDGLMFKDGFLYKKVALSSLIYWGIQPTETELLKFSSSPSNKSSADDLDWVSSIYGSKKRNLPEDRDMKASLSRMKSSKASNLKASTSTENFDDNEESNLHDLVLFGVRKELLNTCTWEYCTSIMKVKARTLDFSVPNAGHVKILRNRKKWGIPLLKFWRTIQFPCFHSHLMSKMSKGALKGLTGAPENNFSLLGRCCAFERVL